MRRFQRQAWSVGFVLVVIGACSAPDRDYEKGSSGAGSGGVGGKLSITSGGRAGGPSGAGAGGDGGAENVGGAPVLSGGTGAVSGTGTGGALVAAAGAGAGGIGETGGSGGEPTVTGGRGEPGAGGSVNPGAGGRANPGTGGTVSGTGGRLGDTCGSVVCSTPPAAMCVDATTVRRYGAGVCNAGTCEYPPSDSRCATNELCTNGACSVCATDTACGPSCAACSANAPHCKATGTTSACVQCLTSRDCGRSVCDTVTNRCVQGQSLLITNQTSVLRFDAATGAALGVSATGGGLTLAYGLAIGPNGHLYVADFSGNAIREYDAATGAYIASPVSTKAPYDIAFGPDGNMYVGISGGTIVRYTPAGASLGTFIAAVSGADLGGFKFYGSDLFVSYIGTTGSLVRYDAKGGRVSTIYDAFSGNGPRAASFSGDGTLFVPEWQTPYVKAFAATSYKPLGNFIADREMSPNSVGFGLDGNLIVLSDNGKESSVRRYDFVTGAFLGVLVAPGSAGLGRATRMLVVPN